MSTNILNETAALIQVGKKAEAQKLQDPFLKANLHNIPAWLLEAELWPTVSQKRKILESGLRYNPGARPILQALAELESIGSSSPIAHDVEQSPSQGTHLKPAPILQKKSKSNRTLGLILIGCSPFAILGLLLLSYISASSYGNTPCIESCMRILFIGNSYTYVNDLPHTFADLAKAGGHSVETGMLAEGGWTLYDHVNNYQTSEKLKSSKWDFVVLQEQSEIPAVEQSRMESMYPAIRLLAAQIEEAGATPVLFETWAHRDGAPEYGLEDYETMQFQIDQGYRNIADELGIAVAPVGEAWLTARWQNPPWELWQTDGSHPNEQGTYLAACVFYAAIFHESPEGLSFRSRLSKEAAQGLQTIAAHTVLENP
jgi:hypothetical protein